ncbi:MAG: SusC/RagA family TonB-linked outer membrane protein [Flavobacteriaceae bacterium]|nr:MAG: SusC/RagA family TonB-linked outer membrane protein [Flavobacteriaceae bacterium]
MKEIIEKKLFSTLNPKILACVVFFVFALQTVSYGQQKTVTGIVSDESGTPLMGVTIIEKNTQNGTSTGFDGEYSINIETGAALHFSYVGFVAKTVQVGGQSIINVQLLEDSESLDEVIVVGYGTQKKSDVTGAVGQVKSDELTKVATVNATEALQGRVAGLTVTKSSGSPGAGVDIKIRGAGTYGNNQPLYIIDGVQASSYYVDPNNIASIEVLKDVSSAAIYGTRAANGVVIITTKKGKSGKPKVSFDSYISFNSARNSYDLLDGKGYAKVHKQMYQNAGKDLLSYMTSTPDVNSDWMDAIFKSAIQTNHSVRVSGASEFVDYSVNGSSAKEEGIILGSDFNKKTLGVNLGIKKGKFTMRNNLTYAETRKEGFKFSLKEAYHISPLIPIYDTDRGSGFGYSNGELADHMNPIAYDHFKEGYTKLKYFHAKTTLSYEIIDGLTASTNLAVSNTADNTFNFHKGFVSRNKVSDYDKYAQIGVYNSTFRRNTMEGILNYKKDFGKHSFDVLLGYSRISEKFDWSKATGEGSKIVADKKVKAVLLDENFKTLNAFIDGTRTATGSNYEYTLASEFGRVNYSFDDTYLFQASIRRDGSSKFGKNNRYGTFTSFALGWKITEEEFMQGQEIFDFLKLRASWGQAGNDSSLDNYYYNASISSGKSSYNGGYVFGYGDQSTPVQGSISKELQNDNLKWETNTSSNIGIDFTMLDYKLKGSLNYYKSLTSDLLFKKELSPSAGINTPTINVGEFKNTGIEIDLTYSNNVNDFNYSLGGTFSTNNNEVTKLANSNQVIYGTGLKFGTDHYVNQTQVGYEAGAYFLTEADGIFQNQAEIDAHSVNGVLIQPNAAPGDMRFKDQNGDGTLNSDDIVYAGTGMATFEYSLNFSADYKGFDATVFFQGVGGNKIYDGNAYELIGLDSNRNFTSNALNAWTPENTNTDIPRAVFGDPNQNNRASTRFLHKGDYLRIKTIQFGYTLPENVLEKLQIDKVRLYVSGQNLFTITNYPGLDPEVAGSILTYGVDRVLYPKYKSFIMGVQLQF